MFVLLYEYFTGNVGKQITVVGGGGGGFGVEKGFGLVTVNTHIFRLLERVWGEEKTTG